MSDTPDPTLWPPPPLRPTVDVLEVERVRVVRTESRLTVTNLAAKCVLWIGMLSSVLNIPLAVLLVKITMFLDANTAAGREYGRHLFSTMLHSHVLQSIFLCEMMALIPFWWFLYTRLMFRGQFVLDKERHTFQRGGKDFCPLSQLRSILVKPNAAQIGKNWTVALVREGGDPRPRWRQLLTYPARPDVTLIAALRKRENAETVAAAIADFAGVPVTGPPE